jgi:S-formylglutathione hydrolase
MSDSIVQESRNKCFGGDQLVVSHHAETTHCNMRFALFLPSSASHTRVPAIYFLSGLTCTEQNVITKAGAQQFCEQHQVAFVCPDTSPRGLDVPDFDATDLGVGAGFYVNATQTPWSQHYRMYDYVTTELPSLVERHFPVTSARGIMGHSMGGHGALVIGLREGDRYRSVSAFSPICAPSQVPWGQKAFTAYLGADETAWSKYDASNLMVTPNPSRHPLLVDVGADDPFLATQLLPETLAYAARAANHQLTLRIHPGYDHSYYFIATFIGEHIAHHAAALK